MLTMSTIKQSLQFNGKKALYEFRHKQQGFGMAKHNIQINITIVAHQDSLPMAQRITIEKKNASHNHNFHPKEWYVPNN